MITLSGFHCNYTRKKSSPQRLLSQQVLSSLWGFSFYFTLPKWSSLTLLNDQTFASIDTFFDWNRFSSPSPLHIKVVEDITYSSPILKGWIVWRYQRDGIQYFREWLKIWPGNTKRSGNCRLRMSRSFLSKQNIFFIIPTANGEPTP